MAVLLLFSHKGKTPVVACAGGGIGLVAAEAVTESETNAPITYRSNKKALDQPADITQKHGIQCESTD